EGEDGAVRPPEHRGRQAGPAQVRDGVSAANLGRRPQGGGNLPGSPRPPGRSRRPGPRRPRQVVRQAHPLRGWVLPNPPSQRVGLTGGTPAGIVRPSLRGKLARRRPIPEAGENGEGSSSIGLRCPLSSRPLFVAASEDSIMNTIGKILVICNLVMAVVT